MDLPSMFKGTLAVGLQQCTISLCRKKIQNKNEWQQYRKQSVSVSV
jgi:hypothetical protein